MLADIVRLRATCLRERIAGMAADPWRGLADASRRIAREMSRGLGIRG